ncbi:replication protein A interacting C-terminal-domain-containing protein [Tribonema minus]|uniref:Replication protein A interacting C-terminal-domain-containing protein n=1 Tax=Tribonema minus TaxID=303371 RepID=A0A835YX80_9STRA|nr:replication protein A interacting C-terminal-domain-containing protein [Tribonema minus]
MCRKLTPEEYTDMMLFIEQALAAELARADASAEHSALEEYEAIEEYELAEREAALARAAAEAEDGRGWRDDEVLCPVCKGGWLLQHGATIMCTCGFRLQTDGEGMQLGVLRQALAEVFTDHRERCHLQPTFRVREEFGAAMLWSECSACGFEQIVL